MVTKIRQGTSGAASASASSNAQGRQADTALSLASRTDDVDIDLIRAIAMDIGKSTVEHIETMYPSALLAVPSSARLSIRNHVYNEIMAALETVDAGEILDRLDRRKSDRRKRLAQYREARKSEEAK